MYIRKTTKRYKDRTYATYVLVESVQTPKGPRQKTICTLGDLEPRPRKEWLALARKLERSLLGDEELFDELDPEAAELAAKVKAAADASRNAEIEAPKTSAETEALPVLPDKASTSEHRSAGPAHIGIHYWNILRLNEILEQAGMDHESAVLACCMVMNRLIDPKSEHAMPEWIRASALGDILGADFSRVTDDTLYRIMDDIHPRRAFIESMLIEHEASIFNLDRTVFFYDLTSTYFEGKANGNAKAARGYSRDKRPDCKQVVLGLAVTRDGFPIFHEVSEGNTQDRATLANMLEMMDKRIGLSEGQTVVVDRGMAYEENLKTLREHPKRLHYIVAMRQTERDQWLADFDDEDGFEEVLRTPSPLNPSQYKSRIRVKRMARDGYAYVLCHSEERILKDRSIREKKEALFLEDIRKLMKRISSGRLVNPVKIGEAIGRIRERYPRAAKYYTIEYNIEDRTIRCEVDEVKRAKASELDGTYLLQSNRDDLDGPDLWRMYMLLTRAENAFRDMKSPLVLRPVCHQFEHRVEAHIFLCMLAYHLLVAVEKTMLDAGVHSSWEAVRSAVETHQVCTVNLPTPTGDILHIRQASAPEPQHREIYKLLGVPTQVMKPVKTWSQTKPTPSEH